MNMEKPILILRPSVVNALFPSMMKSIGISLVVTAFIYGIAFLLNLLNIINLTMKFTILSILIPFVIIALIPFTVLLIILRCTTYFFYHSNITKQFKLVIIKKHSVLYNQITNLKIQISLWDRLTNAGDIVMHTAEHSDDLTLKFIPNTEEIEHKIYNLIRASKFPQSMSE